MQGLKEKEPIESGLIPLPTPPEDVRAESLSPFNNMPGW